jgi:hypothetical protein
MRSPLKLSASSQNRLHNIQFVIRYFCYFILTWLKRQSNAIVQKPVLNKGGGKLWLRFLLLTYDDLFSLLSLPVFLETIFRKQIFTRLRRVSSPLSNYILVLDISEIFFAIIKRLLQVETSNHSLASTTDISGHFYDR